MNKPKLVIIGAGLSGLYSAYLLQDYYDVTILEARGRIGGRILTVDGHDLGPSWVWDYQEDILSLIKECNLRLFSQYTHGDALYDIPEGVERFKTPPSPPSARIKGGMEMLTQALEKKIYPDTISYNKIVTTLTEKEDHICVETSDVEIIADKVIVTLPPRVALETIHYQPQLDESTKEKMVTTPTWMGYAGKCVIEYPEPFWKDQGLSGFVFSPLGPLGEIHDASTAEKHALFGFYHGGAQIKENDENLIAQMVRLFGEKASIPTKIYAMDWKTEPFSTTAADHKPLSRHPEYGYELSSFGGKLYFCSSESAFREGGYLDGALKAAKQTAKMLL